MEKSYISLYKHYSEIYGQNTCIFLMVGKFYEMYDSMNLETGEPHTSMMRAAELLNIQISEKNETAEGGKSFFAGVPDYTLHKFAAVLTRNNWTVIVCDQVKDSAGKVAKRDTVRILSPGTHYETATADAPYVASLWLEEGTWQAGEPPSFGLAFFDLTTGITTGFQGKTTGNAEVWSADTLVQAIQIHNPREILVFWRGDSLSKPSESFLRTRLGNSQALFHIRLAGAAEQGAFEKELVRTDFLERHYSPETMLPIRAYLHLDTSPYLERALIGLLRFMEDHLPSCLEHLQAFQPWTPKGRVHLGNNALTQLNMTATKIEDSVLGLFQKTLTAFGKRGMRNRLLTPISDVEELNMRLAKVDFFLKCPPATLQKLEKYMRQLYDFPRIHRRILTYSATAEDILQLDQTYGRLRDIAILLNESCVQQSIPRFEEFLGMIKEFMSIFSIDKAKRANEDLCFLDSTQFPLTAGIEEEIRICREALEQKLQELCKWAGLPVDRLSLETGKESQVYTIVGNKKDLTVLKTVLARKLIQEKPDEKVISVTAKAKHTFPTKVDDCPLPNIEIILKKTSGGTVETPYLDTIQQKVSGLRANLQAAFKNELALACEAFSKTHAKGLWEYLEMWITDIDVGYCIAKVSAARGYTRPHFIEDSTCASLDIEGLRHPLIEANSTRVQYVQHSVHLGQDQMGWLVYGMNASGKSSLMKSIGVSVLLAQAGCYVPATKFELRPFRSILTRILNQDNLWAGLSSFAVEMSELRDILMRADPFSLVLGDELCSGTESVSATALVASGIEHLLKKEARFIFATHLHGLMNLPEIENHPLLGVYHLKVKYDAGRDILIYDRTLHKGAGSSLYGIEVARALHLPHDFLESAVKVRRQILGKKTEEESHASAWNSNVIRKSCQVCGHDIVRDLEVHHIRHRAEANGLHFADGSSRDNLANLMVVCAKCHDLHHAGKLDIQPLKQTSKGLVQLEALPQEKNEQPKKEQVKSASEERKEVILDTLRRLPNVPLKRIAYDLEVNHGIQVSEATLRAYRKKGDLTET
jgi:DNA mismatch repair protein MutS